MEFVNSKLQVVIASNQFLNRLGIKTLLSVVGIDAELIEVSNWDELLQLLGKLEKLDYLIVSEDLLPSTYKRNFGAIQNYCPIYRTMVIGKRNVADLECSQYVLESYDQKMILDRFHRFFNEAELVSDDDYQTLSDREIDVLKEVALGYSNKEIAERLFISINTVITHRKNITGKLGIKTISGLTVYALLNHLIQPEEVR